MLKVKHPPVISSIIASYLYENKSYVTYRVYVPNELAYENYNFSLAIIVDSLNDVY
jgi:hypothetical protein